MIGRPPGKGSGVVSEAPGVELEFISFQKDEKKSKKNKNKNKIKFVLSIMEKVEWKSKGRVIMGGFEEKERESR